MVRLLHCLVVVFYLLSLPPQHPDGNLDDGSSIVVPPDGGHFNHPGQVLRVVAGGCEDDPEDLCRLKVLTSVS